MPSPTEATRSHRFILSSTGIAFIALATAIASPGSNANIAIANRPQTMAVKQTYQTSKHAMFLTGDADFDYAANMRLHLQLALEMAQAQIKSGKNPALRKMAERVISAHNREIAQLDRWMVANIKSKPINLSATR
jgi:uncharacterized protein (DUF305 family)